VHGYFTEQSNLMGRFLRALRPRMYRTAGLALGWRMGPILAISRKAVSQFAAAGFDPQTIYPYGYFVRAPSVPPAERRPPGGPLRVVYVGALISRKGLDTARDAIGQARAGGIDVTLDLYGSGDPAPWISDGVVHRGKTPVGQAPAIMAGYDLLLLPSYYDGWGVVVNEALQQGVPVLVSSNAGASAMVEASGAGALFAPGDAGQLAALFGRARTQAGLLAEWRARALAYRDRLDPAVAAAYIRDCLEAEARRGPAPPCPWY